MGRAKEGACWADRLKKQAHCIHVPLPLYRGMRVGEASNPGPRHAVRKWRCLSSNANAWSSFQGVLEQAAADGKQVDIICGQEIKVCGEEAEGAVRRWLSGQGFKSDVTDCIRNGDGPNAKSAGVLVGVRKFVGFGKIGEEALCATSWIRPKR